MIQTGPLQQAVYTVCCIAGTKIRIIGIDVDVRICQYARYTIEVIPLCFNCRTNFEIVWMSISISWRNQMLLNG